MDKADSAAVSTIKGRAKRKPRTEYFSVLSDLINKSVINFTSAYMVFHAEGLVGIESYYAIQLNNHPL